ncbi:MAG: Eco57I restriction-modification methylase domain-containing protein [Candidatus Hodarchaeales archaeon]
MSVSELLLSFKGPFWSKFYNTALEADDFEEGMRIWNDLMKFIGIDLKQYDATLKRHLGTSWNLATFYLAQCYFLSIIEKSTEKLLAARLGERSQDWLDAQFPFLHLKTQNTFESPDLDEIKIAPQDKFRYLYESIFPAGVRKILGEFQTPFWLAQAALQEIRTKIELPICDPTCGVGTFLLATIPHLLKEKNRNDHDCDEIARIISLICGFELNPLAVAVARLNILTTYSPYLCPDCQPSPIPIYFADSAINPFKDGKSDPSTSENLNPNFTWVNFFSPDSLANLPDSELLLDVTNKTRLHPDICQFFVGSARAFLGQKYKTIVGNPPWISWDGIAQTYRKRLARHWKFLFTQRGWRSKVAAGRVDLSEILVYSAHQHFAEENATMCFFLPESVFKSYKGGEGFRRFSSPIGSFAVTKVLDLTSFNLFPKASNRTVCTYLTNAKPQKYPVPWIRCSRKPSAPREMWDKTRKNAYPINEKQLDSPWIIVEPQQYPQIRKRVGKSHYRARGGINTGGANPVFWVREVEHVDDFIRIENIHRSIRMEVDKRTGLVERDILRPLIRGRDVDRWKWSHQLSLITPYHPEISAKNALPLEYMAEEFPYALAFLQNFEEVLAKRKEYHRWGKRGPWYRLFRIGPYSFAKKKVIWRHTGFKNEMKACVVEDPRPVVDQKVILVPFQGTEEAHFFCALLNSSTAYDLLSSYLMLDASTHILDFLAIGKFKPENALHQSLAALSKKAHEHPNEASDFEDELTELSQQYWSL